MALLRRTRRAVIARRPDGALDVDERHATNAGKLSPENMGEKSPLFVRLMIVGTMKTLTFEPLAKRMTNSV